MALFCEQPFLNHVGWDISNVLGSRIRPILLREYPARTLFAFFLTDLVIEKLPLAVSTVLPQFAREFNANLVWFSILPNDCVHYLPKLRQRTHNSRIHNRW